MYKNILVPISFGEDRDSKSAVDVAKVLADEGAMITLLHVIEQIPVHTLSYLPADHMAKRHAEVEAKLASLTKGLPDFAGVVTSGHAGRAILDFADEAGSDCIVIASHRPGMQDLLLGSTAAKVVRHAKCCVHVVR
ncbi:universal stress protein [Pseudohalocynthiibacter aestuariivivens]|uniref:Universal stress protein n=1 Tax=Roseovarius pelagicus TaxID=2980108 RepID=A0ABY6DD30_9RHOB|nr:MULTISPECIES: universal stress protein [Rhodobacterales]QIE44044.1 universal stress protein [Pseudohalocynthiibacter aestuariivivens]UXX84057.1 universal stress protein [Roseovarius pelagicus]